MGCVSSIDDTYIERQEKYVDEQMKYVSPRSKRDFTDRQARNVLRQEFCNTRMPNSYVLDTEWRTHYNKPLYSSSKYYT